MSESSFTNVIENYQNSNYYHDALYYRGLIRYESNNYQGAIEDLLSLSQITNFEKIKNVNYLLSLLYSAVKQPGKSELFINKSLQSINDNSKKDKLLYLSITNNIALGNNETAMKLAIEYFENPVFMTYQKKILNFLSNHFLRENDYYNASQVLEFFYTERELSENEKIMIIYNYLFSLYKLKKFQEAINFFEKNNTPYIEKTYSLIADLYIEIDNKDKAKSILEIIIQNSKDMDSRIKLATLYYREDRYNEVINLLKNFTDNNEALDLLIISYYRLENYSLIIETLKQFDYNRINSNNLYLLFMSSYNTNNTDMIIEFYNYHNRSEEFTNKERAFFLYTIGEELYKKKKYNYAGQILKKWTDEFNDSPSYDSVLYMLGISYARIKKYDEALIEFIRIQKLNKKDKIYYESFVEKGEIYFKKRHYNSAIKEYNIYLSNNVTNKRKKQVILQLGNAYYNLKQYNNAYKAFIRYTYTGPTEKKVYQKIASSLLKAEDFDTLIEYFKNKKHTGYYAEYALCYALFQEKDYEGLKNLAPAFFNSNSPYILDVIYLYTKGLQSNKQYNSLLSNYNNISDILKGSSEPERVLVINKIFFREFLRQKQINNAYNILNKNNTDPETIFFIGYELYKTHYIDEAYVQFKRLIPYIKELNLSKKLFIAKFYYIKQEYYDSISILEDLINKSSINEQVALLLISAVQKINDIDKLNNLLQDNRFSKYKSYIVSMIELANGKINNFEKILETELKKQSFNSLYAQEILLRLIEVASKNKNYKQVLNYTDKIPVTMKNRIAPEYHYYEGESLYKLDKKSQAAKILLKVIYIYTNEIYWIDKSVRLTLDIYNELNDTKKFNQTKDIFEDKFYKLDFQ